LRAIAAGIAAKGRSYNPLVDSPFLKKSQNFNRIAERACHLQCSRMSPTIHRERGFRFFFFSREEHRKHIHVHCGEGEAKYWLEPEVKLARNHALSAAQLARIREIIEAHQDEFIDAWTIHFRR